MCACVWHRFWFSGRRVVAYLSPGGHRDSPTLVARNTSPLLAVPQVSVTNGKQSMSAEMEKSIGIVVTVPTAQRISLCPWAGNAQTAEQSMPLKVTFKIQCVSSIEMLTHYITQSSTEKLSSISGWKGGEIPNVSVAVAKIIFIYIKGKLRLCNIFCVSVLNVS